MCADYTGIPVKANTKERFEAYRRGLQAALDRDFTRDEAVNLLLDNAPDPEAVAESKEDSEE